MRKYLAGRGGGGHGRVELPQITEILLLLRIRESLTLLSFILVSFAPFDYFLAAQASLV